MRIKTAACLCILFLGSAAGLRAQWAKIYGGQGSEIPSQIRQTSDGGFIIGGTLASVDSWFIKLSFTGEIAWQKRWDCGGTEQISDIQQTSDGGYVAAGSTYVYTTGQNGWIVKLFPDGNIDWQKRYGGSASSYLYGVREDRSGGYIAFGRVQDIAGSDKHDVLVLKLSARGAIEWQKTIGGAGDDAANAFQQTIDGGYVFAGRTMTFGAGAWDMMFFKLFPDGQLEWQKTYGSPYSERAISVQQTLDLGYIVAGDGAPPSGKYGQDILVLKLLPNGNPGWQKLIESPDGYYLEASSVHQAADGGFLIVGSSPTKNAKQDVQAIKLSGDGGIEWQKRFGGPFDEKGCAVYPAREGGAIVAASTRSYGSGQEDLLILRLNSGGGLPPGCALERNSGLTGTAADYSSRDIILQIKTPDVKSTDLNIAPGPSAAEKYDLCSGKKLLTIVSSSNGTTTPTFGTHLYDLGAEVQITATPGSQSTGGQITFLSWAGDDTSTNNPLTLIMDSDKSIQPSFMIPPNWGGGEGGGTTGGGTTDGKCFIATAAYGSALHPYVHLLREFRDRRLLTNAPGRAFVRFYYRYSPGLAEFISKNDTRRSVTRAALWPVVNLGVFVLRFGYPATLGALGLACAFVAGGAWRLRRRLTRRRRNGASDIEG